MNKAFRGFANVTGPQTDKKINNIYNPNGSSGVVKVLDEKSPGSDQIINILAPQEPFEYKKFQE
jgi:hypothetical protein